MEHRNALLSIMLLALVASCFRTSASPAVSAPTIASMRPRYGAVMSEVGRRFELAGRAASASRFQLAAFEVGEMQELFDEDLPRAALPKEGSTAKLAAMAGDFAKVYAPGLVKAANAKDGAAFAQAFERAAVACNTCHEASGHGFLQITSVPGKSVPDLDPLAAP